MILDATCAHNLETDVFVTIIQRKNYCRCTFNFEVFIVIDAAYTQLYLDRKTINLQPRCT